MRRSSMLVAGAIALVPALAALTACGGGDESAPSRPAVVPLTTPPPPPAPAADADPTLPRTRYSLNNKCYALRSNANDKFVAKAGGAYAASATVVTGAEALFMKPAALGQYLLYDGDGQLLAGAAPVAPQALDAATDAAIWTVKAMADATNYPPAPQYDTEPDGAASIAKPSIAAYRSFVDPNLGATQFRLISGSSAMVVDGSGNLTTAAASPAGVPAESFTFVGLTGASCGAGFPESQTDSSGETFAGQLPDGRVLGMADVHVHISSTTFLGHGFWGGPFNKFGVTHALADCSPQHGSNGQNDVIGTFLGGGTDPSHDTTGWPDFPFWPSAESLTHQAIYWKWLERGWKAGLRIAVNDIVENGTLCELQRNNSSDPSMDCNEMNSAGRQVGTMYAMQDYIDAQYGGRGAGFFQIVYTPEEARAKVIQGKLAVVLGIEISNFLNCQVTYKPSRTQLPSEEDGSGGTENSYACKMTETGAPDEIATQLARVKNWGVRQVISIHEFDNAFGGNGIFFPVINLGNRENSGGLPAGYSSEAFDVSATPTGEFWMTYNCPVEVATPGPTDFSGYFWGSEGGARGEDLRAVAFTDPFPTPCAPTAQGGKYYGGATQCYPNGPQCNARWMTPIGVYLYSKLMQSGFIFDFDHMELEMKSQALELAEAQPITYPIVSTHGTFGGTSNDQARRILRNGGFLYPSLGSSAGLRADMTETLALYNALAPAERGLFGFGFGTDTNGLSGQAGDEPDVDYPFQLFKGGVFDSMPEFATVSAVTFQQPAAGNRTWDIKTDGSAEYGMLADMVAGMNAHGTPEQMRYLYNSAERYLQTWARTQQASTAINAVGSVKVPPNLLRAAPTVSPLPVP